MLSSSESDGGGFKDAILEVKGISASKESVPMTHYVGKVVCTACSGCLQRKLAVVSVAQGLNQRRY